MTGGRPLHYILAEHHIAVPCDDLDTWAHWMHEADQTNGRRVGMTEIGPVFVSTVFLGIDHNFGRGDPVLFETMVFNAEADDDAQWRWRTWDEAERGHAEVVALVQIKVAATEAILGWNKKDVPHD